MLTTEEKKQRQKAILVLRENGFSVAFIAKMLNISFQAVYKIINRKTQ